MNEVWIVSNTQDNTQEAFLTKQKAIDFVMKGFNATGIKARISPHCIAPERARFQFMDEGSWVTSNTIIQSVPLHNPDVSQIWLCSVRINDGYRRIVSSFEAGQQWLMNELEICCGKDVPFKWLNNNLYYNKDDLFGWLQEFIIDGSANSF